MALLQRGAYYNENEPYCAEWLRNLIIADLIPEGDVDDRSIVDVDPCELLGYAQCHFFAGVGGWALAARIAGWPDDRPLWTGSCPCQPFSNAGRGRGAADVRHLWPDFFTLIRACRPACVMGEQVASSLGRDWLHGVRTDLADITYACRAVDIPACAVDAPHIRSRLWWLAVSSDMGFTDGAGRQQGRGAAASMGHRHPVIPASGGGCGVVGDAGGAGLPHAEPAPLEGPGRRGEGRAIEQPSGASGAVGVGDGIDGRLGAGSEQLTHGWPQAGDAGHWDDHEWVICADQKLRRVKPGVRLLAHGLSARVPRIRAGGNSIVPQVAAEVIKAWMDVAP